MPPRDDDGNGGNGGGGGGNFSGGLVLLGILGVLDILKDIESEIQQKVKDSRFDRAWWCLWNYLIAYIHFIDKMDS